MADTSFRPTVFVKQGCPFCLKLRIFLLEAGLLNRVSITEGSTPEEHQKLSDKLAQHMNKVTFPAAEVAPDTYLSDSDALVAHFAKLAGVDPAQLPTYQAYIGGVMPRLQALYRENMELKKKLD